MEKAVNIYTFVRASFSNLVGEGVKPQSLPAALRSYASGMLSNDFTQVTIFGSGDCYVRNLITGDTINYQVKWELSDDFEDILAGIKAYYPHLRDPLAAPDYYKENSMIVTDDWKAGSAYEETVFDNLLSSDEIVTFTVTLAPAVS